jgi:NADPH2:quinone reductase
LFSYISNREETVAAAKELFAVVKSKKLKVRIGQTYALADAAKAHVDMEARQTTGSTILIP